MDQLPPDGELIDAMRDYVEASRQVARDPWPRLPELDEWPEAQAIVERLTELGVDSDAAWELLRFVGDIVVTGDHAPSSGTLRLWLEAALRGRSPGCLKGRRTGTSRLRSPMPPLCMARRMTRA